MHHLDQRNYPYNCWWVAGKPEEFTRKPIQRWLLDTPIAFYRATDGDLVALEDRCPHRWAPLSSGELVDDTLVCPYHGAEFGVDGVCSRFPGQDNVPKRMTVRSFPVVERGPFVWIWLGDPKEMEKADLPPTFDWAFNPDWVVTLGYYKFNANYFMLQENVLDLTHFNFLHKNSFGISNWFPDAEYKMDGLRAGFQSILYPEDFNSPEELAAVGLQHPNSIKAVNNGWMETPAFHQCKAEIHRTPSDDAPEITYNNVIHMTTPVNARETHYWWLVGTDADMPEEAKAGFGDFVKMGYDEDKVMLEAIQKTIDNDPRGTNYTEINCFGDGGGVLARKCLSKILEKENAL